MEKIDPIFLLMAWDEAVWILLHGDILNPEDLKIYENMKKILNENNMEDPAMIALAESF